MKKIAIIVIVFILFEFTCPIPIDSNDEDNRELIINENQNLLAEIQPDQLSLNEDQSETNLASKEIEQDLEANQLETKQEDNEKITKLNLAYDPRFVKSRNQMQAIAANAILLNGQPPQIGPIVNPMQMPYNNFPMNNQIINNQMNNNNNNNNNNDYTYDDYYYYDDEYEEENKDNNKEEKKDNNKEEKKDNNKEEKKNKKKEEKKNKSKDEKKNSTKKKTDTIKNLKRPKNSTKTTKNSNDNINMLNLPRNSRPNPIIDIVPKEKDVKLQLTFERERERFFNPDQSITVRPIDRATTVWGTLTIISNNNNNVNINEDRLSLEELYDLLKRGNNKLSRVQLMDYNKQRLEHKHQEDTMLKYKDKEPKGLKSNSSSIENLKYKNQYEETKDDVKYIFFPYNDGGVIIMNNEGGNVNKQIKKILGNTLNIRNENKAVDLPIEYLSDEEIDNLLQNAIIVNNDNNNNNVN